MTPLSASHSSRNAPLLSVREVVVRFGGIVALDRVSFDAAGALSGGEQQMLAISRALMLRPKLLLLDEPSFGLAPLVTAMIFDILRRLNAERQVAILLVEQNAELALSLADRAYLLETGRIVLSGAAADVAADEGVRKAYLGY